jgi:hypothetical protein
MSQEFNCPHEAKYGGQACAACHAEAYDLLDRANKLFCLVPLGDGPEPLGQLAEWRRKYEALGKKRFGILCMEGWEGRTENRVEIIDETPKRYRIRADRRIKLAGRCRWLEPGDDVLVPKTAVRFEEKREPRSS